MVKPFRRDVTRPARPEDAETLARAEYETAAAREGLLASRPGEIPVESFRDQIRDLAGRGLYVVSDGYADDLCMGLFVDGSGHRS